MPDLNKIFLYRITHLQNISYILQRGITHINSPASNPNYVPIGDGSLINTRSTFCLTNGRKLGDYIPFYFGPSMPMLYVIQKGFNGVKVTAAKDIVYCVTTAQTIIQNKLEYVFADGHAVDSFTSFYYSNDINSIDTLVDFTAVKSKYWNDENDLDLKRRKEAEFLILGDIPADAILGFVVYNGEAGQQVRSMKYFNNKKLVVKQEYYF